MHLSLFLPLISFLVLLFLGKRLTPSRTSYIAIATIGVSFISCLVLCLHFSKTHIPVYQHFTWFSIGKFSVKGNIILDFISIILLTVTSLISLLVHIYAVKYMHGEKNYNRFFAFLGLFTFAMYGLILTDNLLIIYIFWELVGACSYLLISFWHDKESAIKAAKKAFLINRFGDIGFFIGIALLWVQYQTLNLADLTSLISLDNPFVFWASLGLVLAACAKSAQLPFSMWLPDAMEAPAPVSALLHAATMVAAGVYLLIRIDFLFTPAIANLLVIIGSLSTLTAAIAACYQTEMKKILAFSTISQLGLMFIAVGLGMSELAFFHLITHAFFKANLFLCVGFLTKNTNYKADNKAQKAVFIAYCISAASLAGVPLSSGFLSKELILYSLELQANATHSWILNFSLVVFIITSFCTAYYITRQGLLLWHNYILINSKIITNIANDFTPINLRKSIKWYGGEVTFVLALLSLFIPFSNSPFEASFFIRNAAITYSFDILIFGIAMFVLFAGSGAAWLICYYRHCETPKQYVAIRYLNKLYETFMIQFTVSVVNFTSSAAFHQNYFIKVGDFVRILAVRSAKFDNQKIDGMINITAMFGIINSHLLAWFDNNITDGFVKLLIKFTGKIANRVRKLQNGEIQTYLVITLIGILLLCGVMFWL